MNKIAIIGPHHQDGWDVLQKMNFNVFEITDLSKNNLIKELIDVEGIALRTTKLDGEILSKCSKLKIVARHGVGYDSVDLDYLNQKKIALAITGTSNAVSVAEHVMTMFLCLAKNINQSNILTKKGDFDKKADLSDFFELYKKNILILGFGRIGQALAKRCLGFEANIHVYDPFVNKQIIETNKCNKIDFLDGLGLADFISIHMPLNKTTKNLIAKEELNQMKKNCILVNTARGGIINEKDLVWALTNKKIYGAGLDVFETEPPLKNNQLFQFDNVLLTPHNAALTLECRKRMAIETCENIAYYLTKNDRLNKNNIINKKLLELF